MAQAAAGGDHSRWASETAARRGIREAASRSTRSRAPATAATADGQGASVARGEAAVAVRVPVEAAEVAQEETAAQEANEAAEEEVVNEARDNGWFGFNAEEEEEEEEEEEAVGPAFEAPLELRFFSEEEAEEEAIVETEVEAIEAAEDEEEDEEDDEEVVVEEEEPPLFCASRERLQRALSEEKAAHEAEGRRTLAVLRWRRAALFAMSQVSSAARHQAKTAVAAAAARREAYERALLQETATAEAEAERGAQLAQLESILERERKERASERASAQAELTIAHNRLAMLQGAMSSRAVSTATRLATAGLALAEGVAVSGVTATPVVSPARDPAVARVASEQRIQEGREELSVIADKKRGRRPRRSWSLLSCGGARVEPEELLR